MKSMSKGVKRIPVQIDLPIYMKAIQLRWPSGLFVSGGARRHCCNSSFCVPRAACMKPLDHMIMLQSSSIQEQRQKKKKIKQPSPEQHPSLTMLARLNAVMQLFRRIVIFPGRRDFNASADALKDIKHLFASTWRERPLISLSLARWEIERKSFGRAWHIVFFHSCFSDAQMKEIHHDESAILQREREREGKREREK